MAKFIQINFCYTFPIYNYLKKKTLSNLPLKQTITKAQKNQERLEFKGMNQLLVYAEN
jgi:hypothetical protein